MDGQIFKSFKIFTKFGFGFVQESDSEKISSRNKRTKENSDVAQVADVQEQLKNILQFYFHWRQDVVVLHDVIFIVKKFKRS